MSDIMNSTEEPRESWAAELRDPGMVPPPGPELCWPLGWAVYLLLSPAPPGPGAQATPPDVSGRQAALRAWMAVGPGAMSSKWGSGGCPESLRVQAGTGGQSTTKVKYLA